MTNEQLAELKRLEAAATRRFWQVLDESESIGTLGTPVLKVDEDEDIIIGVGSDYGDYATAKADAEFIVSLRNHAHELIAAAELCEQLKEQLRFSHAAHAAMQREWNERHQ